jgi:hypothetical protein
MVALWETTIALPPRQSRTISIRLGKARAVTARPLSPAGRREGEGIFFPLGRFFRELPFDFPARHLFPMAVGNFPKAGASLHLEPVRRGQNLRRLHRPSQVRGIDGGHFFRREPAGQPPRLIPAFVGKRDIGGTGEAILGRERGGAVTNQKDPGVT